MKKPMILGVDMGWTTQLEDMGCTWVNREREPVDPLEEAVRLGANLLRLRVFVNPDPSGLWEKPAGRFQGHTIEGGPVMLGYCDAASAARTAARGKAAGMEVMIDLHYSDVFADPVFQITPRAWRGDKLEELLVHVREHTENAMLACRAQGVIPEYVQVGNEINNGLLHPQGSFSDNPEGMTALLNAGYDAVKGASPDTTVVTHLSMGHEMKYLKPFFDRFFDGGGKTDMIGLSYYPAWFQMKHDPEAFKEVLEELVGLYEKPIILSEIGGWQKKPKETYDLLYDTLQMLDTVRDHAVAGMIYWEPEGCSELLPDKYPLSACTMVGEKQLMYTKALDAYRDYREGGNQ